MHYAIELFFDEETEQRVRRLWHECAELHATDYMFKNNVTPHVTLLVGDEKLQQVFNEMECPQVVRHPPTELLSQRPVLVNGG